VAQNYIYDIPDRDRKMWCSTLHIVAKHNRSQGKESQNWHVHIVIKKDS
jgi:hypothetical protein